MRTTTAKGVGLRTKFKVKEKGDVIHINITTKFSDAKPRVYKCSIGQHKRCTKSKGHHCTCACKGHNHGIKKRWPKILKFR